MSKLTVVGLSGSLSRPSRTSALVSAVLDSIQELEDVNIHSYDLTDVGLGLFAASSFDRLNAESREIIEDIEGADLIVVGTPVYRGSYTGAFKHVFDLVRHDRLRGTPVILTATGGICRIRLSPSTNFAPCLASSALCPCRRRSTPPRATLTTTPS